MSDQLWVIERYLRRWRRAFLSHKKQISILFTAEARKTGLQLRPKGPARILNANCPLQNSFPVSAVRQFRSGLGVMACEGCQLPKEIMKCPSKIQL